MRRLLFIVLCMSVSACAWVMLTPSGEKVRVLDANEVATCKELGNTTVSLMAKVAGINRNEQQLEKDLAMLARNAGANMGGDTVVPVTAVQEGQRTYTVYKCVGVATQ